jgi:hypothetical protein
MQWIDDILVSYSFRIRGHLLGMLSANKVVGGVRYEKRNTGFEQKVGLWQSVSEVSISSISSIDIDDTDKDRLQGDSTCSFAIKHEVRVIL